MGNGALLEDIFPHRNLNKRVSLLDFVGQGRVLLEAIRKRCLAKKSIA
jgi:hypothetical protein